MTVNMNYIDREGYLHWSNELNVSAILRLLRGPNSFGETDYVYRPDKTVLADLYNLGYDCLNCAEYLMSKYAGMEIDKDSVNSRIVGTTSEIGNSDRDNMDAVIRYKGTNNRDVDPEVGQAYFICRTDSKSVPSAGAAFYHAAFVIAKSDDYNFTLEAFHHRGWEFCYYSHTGENSFHDCWAGDGCFEGANVKTVAIELIQ